MQRIFGIGLMILACWAHSVRAQEDAPVNEDEAAVRAAGEAYVKAYNAGDAEALAASWSPDAVYTNRSTGEQVVGREAIAEQFKTMFEESKDITLAVEVASIQFVSPNVAVEHGQVTFDTAESEPEQTDYSAVYVRRDGKWLLDRVTDEAEPAVVSNYQHLQPLEWMIGSWVDADDEVQISTECNWTKNKNYITRSFAVTVGDEIEMSGIQFIGWDAAAKQIRSWTFDSDGGFAEGKWSQDGDRWFVRKKGTTADGQLVSAVNIIAIVDDGAFTLQSVQRTAGGEVLPNVNEVMVVRQ